MADFVESSQAALDAARMLIGKEVPGCRFDAYLKVFGEMVALQYPSPLPWADGSRKRNLFFEAVSQLQGLLYWQAALQATPRPAVQHKLNLLLGGSDLPEYGGKNDPARDVLAEIVLARVLQLSGFDVTLTEHDEDILAERHDCPALVVECKRPSKSGNANAIREAYRQVTTRRLSGSRLGMVVIALDRRLESGGKTWAASSNEAFLDDFSRITKMQSDLMHAAQIPILQATHAPFFGVMIHMPIFFHEDGIAYSATKLAIECQNANSLPGKTCLAHVLNGTSDAVRSLRTPED
jgi:hypothetical protein